MALTKVSSRMITGSRLNVLDFGAVGDYTGGAGGSGTDDTAAFQAAINASSSQFKELLIPAGEYLITDTLNIPSYTQIVGESENAENVILRFKPASSKTLFDNSGSSPVSGLFYAQYVLKNFVAIGNSTNASGNAALGLNANQMIFSDFSNIQFFNFVRGIEVTGSVNNTWERVGIQATYTSCLKYLGNQATTDVWRQCWFREAPVGTNSSGVNLNIRFENCYWEALTQHGVDLSKESYGWAFIDGWSENVPSTSGSTHAMFRLGSTGTTKSTRQAVQIIGGNYRGNITAPAGLMVDSYDTSGFNIIGTTGILFDNLVRIDSTTKDGSIYIFGLTCTNLTNPTAPIIAGSGITAVDIPSKVYGVYPTSQLDAVSPSNNGVFSVVYSQGMTVRPGTSTLLLGTTAINVEIGNSSGGGAVTAGLNNSTTLGSASKRWSEVFAVTGTINTSDKNEKQQIRNLTSNEQAVAVRLKGLIKAFKFNSAVESKGDAARIHVGVIAQEVKSAFEAEGLDAHHYGVFCSDTWTDDDGVEQTRLGVRYEELYGFIISTL